MFTFVFVFVLVFVFVFVLVYVFGFVRYLYVSFIGKRELKQSAFRIQE